MKKAASKKRVKVRLHGASLVVGGVLGALGFAAARAFMGLSPDAKIEVLKAIVGALEASPGPCIGDASPAAAVRDASSGPAPKTEKEKLA